MIFGACSSHHQALHLARELGIALEEAHALAGLGRCARAADRTAEAEDMLRHALAILQRIGAAEATDVSAELDALPERRIRPQLLRLRRPMTSAVRSIPDVTVRTMDASSRPPLRGREQELAVIRRRLDQVRAGTGCVVVVEGSAGLGKTRLLDECVSMARELSFRVGRGAAEPGRAVELSALFDALFEGEPPLADRRALNDVHASSEFLFWLLQDVQSLIEEAALKDPVLICLDDLQWGGTSLSFAMRHLPRSLSSLPVAWVMAFRPDQGLHQVQLATMRLIESGAS